MVNGETPLAVFLWFGTYICSKKGEEKLCMRKQKKSISFYYQKRNI